MTFPSFRRKCIWGEAIILVSKGKLDLAYQLTTTRKSIGLITDGDIRRAMEKWQAAFVDHTVEDIMTRTPKCVLANTKITESQKIMQRIKCIRYRSLTTRTICSASLTIILV